MPRLHSRQLILIFGPSGIGKSTAMNHARRVLADVSFVSLDGLVRDLGWEREIIARNQGVCELRDRLGADRFLELAIDAANRRAARPEAGPVVIDVGAGFLDARKVGDWLTAHTNVVFAASPSVAYQRIQKARQDPRTLAQYREQEFSAHRKRLYRRAQFRVDADCRTPGELGQRLLQLLGQLLQLRPAARR